MLSGTIIDGTGEKGLQIVALIRVSLADSIVALKFLILLRLWSDFEKDMLKYEEIGFTRFIPLDDRPILGLPKPKLSRI